ncbi:MAG: peptidase T, partial [Erysipelotrichaceae bacterium]|nr:peptidase T [Erysipelotrichaceae bacterium]
MKDIVERFLSYTRIDTTSSEDTDVTPSTPNQFILADQLAEELRELGASEVYRDEHAFVYATVRSNLPYKTETVGFLAHMDTSNATSGNNIQAAIIENYDGKDIVHANGLVTSVEEYPQIAALKGKSIIITDGSTLLGADDKAGIAIIMDYVQRLAEHPEIPHGDIRICFTPDEEIGLGIEKINLDHFKCDYAFTVDGGEINDVTYENFNAATAVVTVTGNSIHPGSAKGKMINASQVLMDFHSLLPVFDRPEFTEGREGFNHLISINGTCEKAESVYIIRNHDRQQFEKQKQQFKYCERHINEMYGKEICHANVFDTYKNMVEE